MDNIKSEKIGNNIKTISNQKKFEKISKFEKHLNEESEIGLVLFLSSYFISEGDSPLDFLCWFFIE